MDTAMQSLMKTIGAERSVTDTVLTKVAAILVRAVKTMTERMAREAIASLETQGIAPSSFSLFGFMGYAARQQVEKLSMLGLLRRDKLVLRHTANARKLLKNRPHGVNGDDLCNLAFFQDVVTYMMRHFMATHHLLSMMSEPDTILELSDSEHTAPAPYSSEAIKCVADLNSVPYAAVNTRPVALEPRSINDLLQEVSLKVGEAARVLRVSPKTLEDMCRDGRYPESSYTRYAANGTYHFPTEHVVAFAKKRDAQSHKTRR